MPFAGGISVADKDMRANDPDRTQNFFSKTLHDPPDGIGEDAATDLLRRT